VLIGGGDKKTQQRDIDEALRLWEDYKQRKKAIAGQSAKGKK
jgi:hypothetical protein